MYQWVKTPKDYEGPVLYFDKRSGDIKHLLREEPHLRPYVVDAPRLGVNRCKAIFGIGLLAVLDRWEHLKSNYTAEELDYAAHYKLRG